MMYHHQYSDKGAIFENKSKPIEKVSVEIEDTVAASLVAESKDYVVFEFDSTFMEQKQRLSRCATQRVLVPSKTDLDVMEHDDLSNGDFSSLHYSKGNYSGLGEPVGDGMKKPRKTWKQLAMGCYLIKRQVKKGKERGNLRWTCQK